LVRGVKEVKLREIDDRDSVRVQRLPNLATGLVIDIDVVLGDTNVCTFLTLFAVRRGGRGTGGPTFPGTFRGSVLQRSSKEFNRDCITSALKQINSR